MEAREKELETIIDESESKKKRYKYNKKINLKKYRSWKRKN